MVTPWLALASWGTALAGEEGGPPPHCQAGSHLSFVDPGVGLIFTAGCRWEFDSSLARPDGPSLGGQHSHCSSHSSVTWWRDVGSLTTAGQWENPALPLVSLGTPREDAEGGLILARGSWKVRLGAHLHGHRRRSPVTSRPAPHPWG